ncbi:MAG: nicotinate-nucleotide adenylyltransferase [Clostridia bacterium]|nr:nicotinate-nucleotide adenylyltransferase [Clostridia bacterium]
MMYNKGMKIGIYGGTFDPIHNGHIGIAKAVMAELELDSLFFVVAADPPHKDITGRTPAEIRLKMVELALENEVGLTASDIEIKRGGVSYTVDTLEYFSERFPGAELFFVLGADMLSSFSKWYRPDRILSLARLAAVQRSGQAADLEAIAASLMRDLGGTVIVTGICGEEISSTEIREKVRDALPVDSLVPFEVELFIDKNLLYMPEELKEVKSRLEQRIDDARLEHSLLTAREAVMLAHKHGLDTVKARLCGLIHDCAKLRGSALESYMKRLGFKPSLEERRNPYMIHARLGAFAAEREYGIADPQILNAIRLHTLGSADMTPFDEVIFLADKLEPTRAYRRIAHIRELAYEDLDAAVAAVIRNNIAYNRSRKMPMHPSTFETLEAIEMRNANGGSQQHRTNY